MRQRGCSKGCRFRPGRQQPIFSGKQATHTMDPGGATKRLDYVCEPMGMRGSRRGTWCGLLERSGRRLQSATGVEGKCDNYPPAVQIRAGRCYKGPKVERSRWECDIMAKGIREGCKEEVELRQEVERGAKEDKEERERAGAERSAGRLRPESNRSEATEKVRHKDQAGMRR